MRTQHETIQAMEANYRSAQHQPVRTVERTLAILSAFSLERPELALQELSEQIGLAKSTTHRILQTLIHEGFVEHGRGAGTYRLGLRAATLGGVALWDRRPSEEARTILGKVRDMTGETAGISVLQGRDAVVIDRAESWHSLAANIRLGALLPGHASSTGKALLASLSRDELTRLFPEPEEQLPRLTARTIGTARELFAYLEEVRERGFAIDDRELTDELRCVGVPIRGPYGDAYYALGISASAARVSRNELEAFAERLKESASAIAPIIGLYDRHAKPSWHERPAH